MIYRCSRKEIENFICALAGILSMNPYFLWPSFFHGLLNYIAYIIYFLSAVIMIKKGAKLRSKNLISTCLLIFIYLFTYLHSFKKSSILSILGGGFLFLYLVTFTWLDRENQKEIFRSFTKLFVISLIPGLIYYVLECLGISLSIGTLYSENQLRYANSVESLLTQSSGYYKLYIGAVLRINANTRFSGIYDEAGLIGTVGALCLIGNKMDLKRDIWSRWIFLFVILSFSLAGYILLLIYILLDSVKKKQWKIPLILLTLTFAFFIILNLSSNNPLIINFQNRFRITESGISLINNRETSNFNIGYSQLKNGTILEKMFGFGRGASTENIYMNGSSSVRSMIFNYGYFGFSIIILEIIYLYRGYFKRIWSRNWSEFVLLILFLISIYQRPSIYYPYYFVILYGGAANLAYKQITEREMK